MNKYTSINGVLITECEDEFVISKGFLHKQEVSIDKNKSSKDFIDDFSNFYKNGQISLIEKSESDQDFKKLAQFGLVHLIMDKSKKNMIIVDDGAKKFFDEFIDKEENIIITTKDFLNENEVNILNEQKDTQKLSKVSNNVMSMTKDFNLYVALPYTKSSFIRAVNQVTKKINKVFTLLFFDNENIFALNIRHGETGCYECLEKSLISKFPGNMSTYENDNHGIESFDIRIYGIILSILINEIKNVKLFSDTSLSGNVLHLYLPTYEYDFDFNKRQTSCSVCSTMNNTLFEEQNMRSVEIMQEVMSDD